MFSAILMAAMATTTSAPEFFCKPHCAPTCAPVSYCCKPVMIYSCNGCYSCYGCYGSCFGSCYGCYGSCYGSCFGSCYGCYGSVIVPSSSMSPAKGKNDALKPAPAAPAPQKANDLKKPAAQAAPARVIVELPADAKLFVDGMATETIGSRRTFSTPELTLGTNFYYELKVVNADNTVRFTKLVVRAGEEAVARFESDSTAGR